MTDLFKGYGIISDGILNVSPKEAFELIKKGVLIIDVREKYLSSFKIFDVSEMIIMPASRIREEYQLLPPDSYMIIADAVGLRSKEVILFLKAKGLDKIANMAGGIVDWERDGLPIAADISQRLSGSCMCQLKPREGKKGTR
jgi:rhodanese-related sulfurtransferase